MTPARMAQVFVELSDTVLDTFDIIEFLDNLTERCVELLDADAAGLMLADQRNRLNLMAATVQRARVLGLFELQVQEGPSLDCFTTGQAITNLSLAESRDGGQDSARPRSSPGSGPPTRCRCGCVGRSSAR